MAIQKHFSDSLQFINVCEDSSELYEYCKENGFYNGSWDEFCEDGEELAFFEGDPDMIKVDGETGYFALCGDKVFYYMDSWYDTQVRGILRDFFNSGSMYHYGYYRKFVHGFRSMSSDSCRKGENLWDAWRRLNTSIAYRGGAGYCYDIIPLRSAA